MSEFNLLQGLAQGCVCVRACVRAVSTCLCVSDFELSVD